MSILFFAGFDCFDTGYKGGSGVDQNDPVNVGLLDTPLADWLSMYYGASYPANAMTNVAGVTGLEMHKIGQGKERRNTYVLQGGRVANSTAVARLNTKALPSAAVLGKEWIYRVGFNWTDFTNPADTPAAGYGVVFMDVNGASPYNVLVRSKDATGVYLAFGGGAIVHRPVRGEPVHVEIEFGMFAPSNAGTFNVTLKLYINGDLVATAQPWSSSQTAVSNFFVRWSAAAQSSATSQMTFGISDLVISDNVGPGGVDPGRLGPQLVLPAEVTAVTAPDWTATGGTPVQVLSDRSDETYLTSPLASGNMTVAMNLGLPVGADVNGLVVYGRTRRDLGAAAPLYYDVVAKRKSDDVQVANTSNVALTSNVLNRTLVDIGKGRANYADQLAFADSGLVNFNFTIKKNGA